MSVAIEHEYRTIDKSGWEEGPWQEEADKLQWTDAATGLPCMIRRHSRFGYLCGYVGVQEGHPLFGVGYSDCPRKCGEWCDHTPADILDVHGGINYTDACREGPEETSICHVPQPGTPGHVWWLGFDVGHSGDLSPGEAAMLSSEFDRELYQDDVYRTVEYVQAECANLAAQLVGIAFEGLRT